MYGIVIPPAKAAIAMGSTPDKPDLRRQRIFLAIFFGLAIALCITAIVGSLNGWRDQDADARIDSAPPVQLPAPPAGG